jgi:ABC-type multidrug transport system permease subunit
LTLFINIFSDVRSRCPDTSIFEKPSVNITKKWTHFSTWPNGLKEGFSFFILTTRRMLSSLQKRWNVNGKDMLLILCVFAVTGLSTAFLSKAITGWVGFTSNTHWSWKLLLRLCVLLFGYQAILLTVAFIFGQFSFFWRFERRLLERLKLIRRKT